MLTVYTSIFYGVYFGDRLQTEKEQGKVKRACSDSFWLPSVHLSFSNLFFLARLSVARNSSAGQVPCCARGARGGAKKGRAREERGSGERLAATKRRKTTPVVLSRGNNGSARSNATTAAEAEAFKDVGRGAGGGRCGGGREEERGPSLRSFRVGFETHVRGREVAWTRGPGEFAYSKRTHENLLA
jgi:hypothetical protein